LFVQSLWIYRVLRSSMQEAVSKRLACYPSPNRAGAKQLNLIRWNEREPKWNIREWSPDGQKMGKGVTLSKEELVALQSTA
jgi:hypothetical protein